METKLSYSCVTPHLMRLRLCGYYQIDPKSPKLQRLFHSIYMRFSLIWIVIYTIQQALKVYEVQEDIDKVIATLFLFLTHTDSIYKQVVLWIKSDKIEELLDIMRGSLYNQDNPDHKPFLLEVARYSLLIVRIDNYLALCTCFLWVLLPFVLHLQGKPVEFGVWLPFDVNVDPVFYFTALYVWGTTSWLAFCNTTIDVLISFFLAQCKTQLSIVRYDLENLIQRSKTESLLTGESHAEVLNKRFRKILLHHAQIAYFVKKVEDIFSFVIIYQFSVSGWIICTSVYRMVNMNVFSIQFLSMILYICCMLIEIFMYCYYGNEVTSESTKVMESAYFMNWLSTNTRHRRHLIFFMERIKRPIQISAGVIVPLSNETFISIVKSSYTFYALLKSTSE
ncbi:putative odorant receptor 92a [Melitaea cinxia]|uniref:putative odorant receptor 92a n=1 Tax=Melitaea cinxia TaxID=113334 RepID=UPI001E26E8EC|nr:putative odorant receptor 92a [Melitaea cinxia]